MNGNSRLEQLLQFLEQDPCDPFNIYAVALEYRKTEPTTAKKYFDELLQNFPDYLPTYYHAGMLWQELEQINEAKEIFLKGMEKARKAGKTKDFNELQNVLNQLLYTDNEQET